MACDCESRPVRMATLLKRWKMRMLGKYKHLSGIASDSECRRSEASLRSAVSTSCSGPVGVDSRATRGGRPAAQPCQGGRGSCASFPRATRRRRAPLIRATEPEPQPDRTTAKNEFSFTLYDLDGQGRVTQDDIAGLVRTIYELVGSSMDVPAGGGKTINVRLTVTPEPAPPCPPPEADSAPASTLAPGGSAHAGRRAPLALPSGATPAAPRRCPRVTSPVMSEMTSQCGRRHLAMEPPAKRHLTELLRDSMEKNNVTYNNVISYNNLKRSHTCRDHVRHGTTCRPVETENHYCTVGELYCPNATAAGAGAGGVGVGAATGTGVDRYGRPRRRGSMRRATTAAAAPSSPRQQQQDDYELLTRCAQFALRAEEEARQRSRRSAGRAGLGAGYAGTSGGNAGYTGGGGVGGAEPPLPPRTSTSRPVQHHHRHEHVHQHYHHYASNVLIL